MFILRCSTRANGLKQFAGLNEFTRRSGHADTCDDMSGMDIVFLKHGLFE
jgi:hypothetical protein